MSEKPTVSKNGELSLERVALLAKEWRDRASNLRKQSSRTLKAAGISAAMRDYAVARYEDSADEVERAIRGGSNVG